MKTKYYIGLLSVLLLAGSPAKAQDRDEVYLGNDETATVINNYYGDYDYYYSSRINRFHRSFSVFDYYSPLFTDSYWYTYRPYTWGISIYTGGFGFSEEYNPYFPVYFGNSFYTGYFDYGWFDPYFCNSYYCGYEPYYYSYWYNPVIINLGGRNRWTDHYWNRDTRYYSGNHSRWNDYRPSYYAYNNRYNNFNNNSIKYSERDKSRRFEGRRSDSEFNSNRTSSPERNRNINQAPAVRNPVRNNVNNSIKTVSNGNHGDTERRTPWIVKSNSDFNPGNQNKVTRSYNNTRPADNGSFNKYQNRSINDGQISRRTISNEKQNSNYSGDAPLNRRTASISGNNSKVSRTASNSDERNSFQGRRESAGNQNITASRSVSNPAASTASRSNDQGRRR